MPLGLVRAIALHQIVGAESRGPADRGLGAAGPKLLHDGDLAVFYQEVAVGQRAVGALRVVVDNIVWIEEQIDEKRRTRFVRWECQVIV